MATSSQEQSNQQAIREVTLEYSSREVFPYDNIYALLVTWADDNVCCPQRDDLSSCLQSVYQAKCYLHTISYDDDNAQASLSERIQDVSHKAERGHNVLIIYYGGDSAGSGKQFILSSLHETRSQTYIAWQYILKALATVEVDVLFFLDCPYMGSIEEHRPYVRREILTMHDDAKKAGSGGHQWFTQALQEALRHYDGQPITVIDLCNFINEINPTNNARHISLSRQDLEEITLAVMRGPFASSNRQVALDVEWEPGQRPSDRTQEVKLIKSWFDSSLTQYGDLRPEPGNSDNEVTYHFKVGRSVTADSTSWQPFAQCTPGNVRDLNLKVNSLTGTDKGKVNVGQDPLNDLVQSLAINREIKQNFPTRTGRYTQVKVLPIMWKKVEEVHKLEPELERVRSVFTDKYGYEVDPIFPIPSNRKAFTELSSYINERIKQNNDSERLLIVIYSGHGLPYDPAWADTKGPMVVTDNAEGRWEVDWDKILHNLLAAVCDVVVLMNCCYAGHATLDPVLGTNEILAATDRDTPAWSDERSFLRHVIESLEKERPDNRVSIEDLERELRFLNSAPGGQKVVMPMRKIHPETRRSIVLEPLDPNPNPLRSTDNDATVNDPSVQGSFFVEYVLEDPALASQIEWHQFFEASSYPDRVKELRFHTASRLQQKLSRGDRSGTATPQQRLPRGDRSGTATPSVPSHLSMTQNYLG